MGEEAAEKGYRVVRVEPLVLTEVNRIKKGQSHSSQSQTIKYLCDLHKALETGGGFDGLNELPDAVLVALKRIRELNPTLLNLQLDKLLKVLTNYAEQLKSKTEGN